ncbi:hypothetical protein GUJ93_ZPchr0013g37945 [Zizania palustris]|uniref:Uncharacterized protein n=1 Tax=Zizania palustris TaxID=103762 RepID=A0A8J5WYE1_ZIZPA|nr:hypothetical protein GUJ93_ZPchr0013g37945 [Zizania palustris]
MGTSLTSIFGSPDFDATAPRHGVPFFVQPKEVAFSSSCDPSSLWRWLQFSQESYEDHRHQSQRVHN